MSNRPALAANIASLPTVYSSSTHNIRELAAQVKRGKLKRIRPGIYVENAVAEQYSPKLLLLAAVSAKLGSHDTISHFSAAYLWNLPDIGTDPRMFVSRSPASKHRRPGFCISLTTLHPRDRIQVLNLHVTSLERTALDCALASDGPNALAIVDSALRAGATKATLVQTAGRYAARNAVQLRRLIELAVHDSDSVPESATRYWMWQAGLRNISTQHKVVTARGTFYLDCGIEEIKLAVEYDGKQKYEDPQALFREKLREDAIRAEGWTFLRVTASDLRNPALLTTRLTNLARRLGYDFTPLNTP